MHTEERNTAYDIRALTRLIERIGEDGSFQAAGTDQMHEIIAALQNAAMEGNGKASGSLTLKIEFKLDGGMVRVGGRITASLPKAREHQSHLFVTPDNFLTLMNPRQRELPLTRVATAHGDAVRVS